MSQRQFIAWSVPGHRERINFAKLATCGAFRCQASIDTFCICGKPLCVDHATMTVDGIRCKDDLFVKGDRV